MLDVARQTYKELTEEIHQHLDDINRKCREAQSRKAIQKLTERDLGGHGLNCALKYDQGRKYYLKLKAKDLDQQNTLPNCFINRVRKRDNIECQTLNLVKLDLRLSDTCNEVDIRSDIVIQCLMKVLWQNVPHLFRVCESVALVDMIASFAQLATTQDYVRPELSTTLALKSARHPILEKVRGG